MQLNGRHAIPLGEAHEKNQNLEDISEDLRNFYGHQKKSPAPNKKM